MPPFGILANHKIKMCHNSMQKIMIQKITQNNWNFWTVNLIMRANKIVNQSSDFPVRRTGSYRHKKALVKFGRACSFVAWRHAICALPSILRLPCLGVILIHPSTIIDECRSRPIASGSQVRPHHCWWLMIVRCVCLPIGIVLLDCPLPSVFMHR